MPPASPESTLVGFSPQVDWRPLTFLKPIPAYRVCSACGLVRKRIYLLPCMHALCECCYDKCDQEDSHACPLDGYECEKQDVDMKDFPADELLSREVKCWNEKNGCQYVTTALGMAQHYLEECQNHSVDCPKCSTVVLSQAICTHLRSDSCSSARVLESLAKAHPSHQDETASSTSFEGTFEKHAAEIMSCLRPMALDINMHGERLDEISLALNALKENLSHELSSSVRQNDDSVAKSLLQMATSVEEIKMAFTATTDTAATSSTSLVSLEKTLKSELTKSSGKLSQVLTATKQIKADLRDKSQKTLNCIRDVLQYVELQGARCVFVVPGLKILEDTAWEHGSADYFSKKVYLHGYCLEPGVTLKQTSPNEPYDTSRFLHLA